MTLELHTAALDLQLAAASYELLGWILADHMTAVPMAKAEGIGPHVFDDDLRIIWIASDLAAEHGTDRDCMFRLIENGLRCFHFWDESQSALNVSACLWSTARLMMVYNGYFPSTVAVRSHSRRVMEMDRRRRRAETLAAELVNVLDGQDLGDVSRTPPVAVVMSPSRRCA